MSAIPVLTPLKNAFQQSRAHNNIELILPELLSAQLHVVIGGQSESPTAHREAETAKAHRG